MKKEVVQPVSLLAAVLWLVPGGLGFVVVGACPGHLHCELCYGAVRCSMVQFDQVWYGERRILNPPVAHIAPLQSHTSAAHHINKQESAAPRGDTNTGKVHTIHQCRVG